MGEPRKEKPKQTRLLSKDDKVLGQTLILPDGTSASHTWSEKIEKKALTDAVVQAKGNKTEAAKLLGMTFRALRYKLTKFGL